MRRKRADQIIKNLGPRLRHRRKSLHFTQEQLAEALNISTNQISRVERGYAAPSLKLLVQWCDILDISMDALFFSGRNVHTQSIELIQKLECLDDRDRVLIRLFIDQRLSIIDKKNR